MPHRVFLVEDHYAMRAALLLLLRRQPDLEVVGVAESAEEAFASLDRQPCDLIVTNWSLPGVDGIELVARMRARRPDLAAIVISADDGESVGRRALAAGAHAFLDKSDLVATLPGAIREALVGDGREPVRRAE